MSTLEPWSAPIVYVAFIGRRADRAALCGLIDRPGTGRQIALLCGEAGVGKSRQVAEATAYAAGQGFLVLQGHCFQMDSAYPNAPLLDLLRAGAAPTESAAGPGPDRRHPAGY